MKGETIHVSLKLGKGKVVSFELLKELKFGHCKGKYRTRR